MTQLAFTTAVDTATRGPARSLGGPPAHWPGVLGNMSWGHRGLGVGSPGGPFPSTHQLLWALNHSQRGLMGVAVLPARVPVPRLLGEVVAFPSVEQPVLGAGRLALDAALGSCREEGLSTTARPAPVTPRAPGAPSTGLGFGAAFSGEHLTVPGREKVGD